jgi:hypothetical protein
MDRWNTSATAYNNFICRSTDGAQYEHKVHTRSQQMSLFFVFSFTHLVRKTGQVENLLRGVTTINVLSKARFVTVATNKCNKNCHYETTQKKSFTSIGSYIR